MTVEMVDWTGATVVLRHHKTANKGKCRVIYLTAEALGILQQQRERYGSGHLFRGRGGRPFQKQSITNRMLRLQRRLGIKATAYGFRHSFATDALANGVPDAQVAELLGHSGTAMLHKHYSHLTARAKALRDALGRVR
jgi:integrase